MKEFEMKFDKLIKALESTLKINYQLQCETFKSSNNKFNLMYHQLYCATIKF